MLSYLPILVFTVFTAGFLAVTLLAARLLRHGGSGATDISPYECGNPAESLAHDHRFSVRYYLIAVLFVVFDVETIFLFPWAVRYRQMHWFGVAEVAVFLVILAVGYIWAYKKGALEWV
jgi:NADH-quinone oxidoreductase subunit A